MTPTATGLLIGVLCYCFMVTYTAIDATRTNRNTQFWTGVVALTSFLGFTAYLYTGGD